MEMKNINLPLIALRGMTVLPDMVIHFDISRKKSIHAVEKAMEKDQKIFLATQVDPEVSDPEYEDLYHVGTLVKIKQLIKLPNSVVPAHQAQPHDPAHPDGGMSRARRRAAQHMTGRQKSR